MKKILFISSTSNISTGSYRIWVNDLSNYFNSIGIDTKITNRIEDSKDYDIIICGKGDANTAVSVKNNFPNKVVGVINLAADKIGLPLDFVIVGSIEEIDSLSEYNNVFMFPLIEKMYQGQKCKVHGNKKMLRLGFHGSHTHLAKFEPNLRRALEELDDLINFELLVITSDPNFNWKIGRPKINNLQIKQWNFETVKKDLSSCDIGLVPNITQINAKSFPSDSALGLYNTDYILRMKNKSNAGRAFVFHQLGIPVVADITPSNFHVMGGDDCGYLVNSKDGWKRSILSLTDKNKRTNISTNAFNRFNELYDPKKWADKLYKQILEIAHG